jgi:hypothetical protein
LSDAARVLIDALETLGVPSPAALRSSTSSADSRLLAIGWATVELDRAADQLLPILPRGASFRVAERSVALGAACRLADAVRPDWPLVVLLEPDTEGRLAATIARSGEGWVAAWLRAASLAGVPASSVLAGPLGPERLRLGDPVHGPHHLFL